METLTEKKTFLLLGETGSGKTTLINYLYNYFNGETDCIQFRAKPDKIKIAVPNKYWKENVVAEYKDHDSELNIEVETESQTSECLRYEIKSNDGSNWILIDSPGFNNKKGIEVDDKTFKSVLKSCIRSEYINGIFLVINGTSPRLNDSSKCFIEYLINLFPDKLKENILVVLTNCNDTSCNFEIKSLKNLLEDENPKIFYMQNNLFKWDKSELNDRRWRLFSESWADSCDTLREILTEAKKLKSFKTESLAAIENKKKKLMNAFKDEIKNSISIIDAINDIEFKSNAINEALLVKNQNLNHVKEFQIEAIPFVVEDDKKEKTESFIGKLKKNFKSKSKQSKNNETAEQKLNDKEAVSYKKQTSKESKSSKESMDVDSDTLNENTLREHEHEIEGKVNEEEKKKPEQSEKKIIKPVNLNFKFKDEAAILQFEKASNQIESAENEIEVKKFEIEKLEKELDESLNSISVIIIEIRSLIKGFNFFTLFYPIIDEIEKTSKGSKSNILDEYIKKVKSIIECTKQ